MKFLKMLTLLSLALLFSCGEDDEINASIVGEWSLSALDYTSKATTSANGITLTVDGAGTGYDMNSTISFTADPNRFTTDGTYSVELTVSYLGQTFRQDVVDVPFLGEGTWEVNGEKVTMIVDGETAEFEVLSFSEKEIILHYLDTVTQMQDGTEVTAEIDAKFTFTR